MGLDFLLLVVVLGFFAFSPLVVCSEMVLMFREQRLLKSWEAELCFGILFEASPHPEFHAALGLRSRILGCGKFKGKLSV